MINECGGIVVIKDYGVFNKLLDQAVEAAFKPEFGSNP